MSDTNKSGYELRTDLLGMAIGIVSERVQRQMENEHLKPEGTRQPVVPYTTEDIITEAEKLYMFVQKKQTYRGAWCYTPCASLIRNIFVMGLYRRDDRLIHYIHIPKCGGRSIGALLKENNWIHISRDVPEHLRDEIRNTSTRNRSQHIHRKIWKEWEKNYEFQFAIVRNPYSRLISHLKQITLGLKITKIEMMWHVQQFFDEIKDSNSTTTKDGYITGGIGFADNHWRPQVDFLGPDTFVYKLESDIEEILSDLKKRDIISKKSKMPHEFKGKWEFDIKIPWKNFLRTHDNFINFYHLDFEILEYKKINYRSC